MINNQNLKNMHSKLKQKTAQHENNQRFQAHTCIMYRVIFSVYTHFSLIISTHWNKKMSLNINMKTTRYIYYYFFPNIY